MPDNYLIVPSSDVANGRITTLTNARQTSDLALTVGQLTNGVPLTVFRLSTGISGTPQGVSAGLTALAINDPAFADFPVAVQPDLQTARVPLSGTFVGTAPTTLEFRILDDSAAEVSGWAASPVTTSGNTWAATRVMLPGNRRYLAQVRAPGVTAVAQTVPFRTAGIMALYGQSNTGGMNGAREGAFFFRDDVFVLDRIMDNEGNVDSVLSTPRGDGLTTLLNDMAVQTGLAWVAVMGGTTGSYLGGLDGVANDPEFDNSTIVYDNFISGLQILGRKPLAMFFHQGEGDAPAAATKDGTEYFAAFDNIVSGINAAFPDEAARVMPVYIASLATGNVPTQVAGWAAVDGWHKDLVNDRADTFWGGSWRDARRSDGYHGYGSDYVRRAKRSAEYLKVQLGLTPAFETFRIASAQRISPTETDVTVIHGQGTAMNIIEVVANQNSWGPNTTVASGLEISDGSAFVPATGTITGPNTIRWTHAAIAEGGCTLRYLYGPLPDTSGMIVDNSSTATPLLHEEEPIAVADAVGYTPGVEFAQQALSMPGSGSVHTFTPTLELAGAERFLYTVQIGKDRTVNMTVNGIGAPLIGNFISPNSNGYGAPTSNVNEVFVFETDQVGQVVITVSGGNFNPGSYEVTLTEAKGVTGPWSVADAVFRMPVDENDNTITHDLLTIPAGDLVCGVAIGTATPANVADYVSINYESYSGAFGAAQAIVASAVSDGSPRAYQVQLTTVMRRMGSLIATISAA